MLKFFFPAVLYFIFFSASAQDTAVSRQYPQTYFRAPLDLPPALAGSFGEIRGNHFHSGLDYRTNQREGYPVYAAADGYVSRLRVQIGGGGNIVYLTHPNGYTTVYMHLQRFNQRILQVIRNYQYRQQVFDVDFPLLPIEIPVKKGEIIAWSGSTGAVAGPHLHFEIRDSRTEETINPQLFGFKVPDQVKPQIGGLYVYRLNGLPFSEHTPKQYFQVTGTAGNYHINQSPVINISGEAGFGIITFDQNLPGGSKNGVYSTELLMDGQTIFSSVLERFSFSNSRAVNSHIDYPALMGYGRTIQKSFTEPGNPLTIYRRVLNRGLVNLTDNEVHSMQYIIKDVAGNASTLSFKIKYNAASVIAAPPAPPAVKTFYYNQDNEYSNPELKIKIPRGNLYSDIDFSYSVSARPQGAYSRLHHIHTRLIPLHEGFTLWIRPDSSLKLPLLDKAVIVDNHRGSVGGIAEDGYIKAVARYFGNFYLALDTVAPVIKPVNIAEGKSMAGSSRMSFKISDNLSGIRSFSATIDGKWVLMEYDQKTALIWYTFDSTVAAGKHTVRLTVTDMKMNAKTYTANFIR